MEHSKLEKHKFKKGKFITPWNDMLGDIGVMGYSCRRYNGIDIGIYMQELENEFISLNRYCTV